jgi:hypothetical protein
MMLSDAESVVTVCRKVVVELGIGMIVTVLLGSLAVLRCGQVVVMDIAGSISVDFPTVDREIAA